MPNFITDSDLLPFEPRVFHELPFAGQTKLIVSDAQIDGATVTSAAGGFAALAPGDVAVLGGGAYKIAAVADDNTLTLDPPPVTDTDPTLLVRTFAPQATLAHEHILQALGRTEEEVESAGPVSRLEALCTLSIAYAAGVSVLGDSSRLIEKLERYKRQYLREWMEATIVFNDETILRPAVPRMDRV